MQLKFYLLVTERCDVRGSFSVKKFVLKYIEVRDIIGVLKGTLLNACVVEVGDGDIMDVF